MKYHSLRFRGLAPLHPHPTASLLLQGLGGRYPRGATRIHVSGILCIL